MLNTFFLYTKIQGVFFPEEKLKTEILRLKGQLRLTMIGTIFQNNDVYFSEEN